MSEGNAYELPSYFQDKQSSNRFSFITSSQDQRDRDKRTYERQFVETIKREMTTNDASDLAISSAFGEIRLPHVIIPNLTNEGIKKFWTISDNVRIAALYTLMCSSLYYEVLMGKINFRKGKKSLRNYTTYLKTVIF